MIHRIVQMKFKENELQNFLILFERVKREVNDFEGCCGMKLLQSKEEKNVVFTYSVWKNEEALQSYRNSVFFRETWPDIKKGFSIPAKAWSTEELFDGFTFKVS